MAVKKDPYGGPSSYQIQNKSPRRIEPERKVTYKSPQNPTGEMRPGTNNRPNGKDSPRWQTFLQTMLVIFGIVATLVILGMMLT